MTDFKREKLFFFFFFVSAKSEIFTRGDKNTSFSLREVLMRKFYRLNHSSHLHFKRVKKEISQGTLKGHNMRKPNVCFYYYRDIIDKIDSFNKVIINYNK